MRDGVQLITYVDRLAGTLSDLTALLDGPLEGAFTGTHLLPFFDAIDGADAGFDPTDHREVDPRLGSWDDVALLASRTQLVADLIVNHVSDRSPWVREVVARGDGSPYASMLLTFDAAFPAGASEQDLLRIYRPRPGLPFTRVALGGRPRLLWTTFTAHQIDLDQRSDAAVDYLEEVLSRLAAGGVRCVRLDAVGYAVKTPGTSCFLTAQTLDFVRRLSGRVRELGMQTLAEVHAPQALQERMAECVDYVYDFALPPLVLHAVHSGDVEPLLSWLARRPPNVVTVLDTHDGIGVIDVGPDPSLPGSRGLLGPAQIDALVEAIHQASGGGSRRATGAAASNLDLYQVNCSWYDAVGRDDARMCLTRLLQLFVPGIPQVYYVGMLAGGNDLALLERTGVGREVNRHRYGRQELAAALDAPVTRAQLAMFRFRNTHPAFGGSFTAAAGPQPGSVLLGWTSAEHHVRLETVPGQSEFTLTWSQPGGTGQARTVAELGSLPHDAPSGAQTRRV